MEIDKELTWVDEEGILPQPQQGQRVSFADSLLSETITPASSHTIASKEGSQHASSISKEDPEAASSSKEAAQGGLTPSTESSIVSKEASSNASSPYPLLMPPIGDLNELSARRWGHIRKTLAIPLNL